MKISVLAFVILMATISLPAMAAQDDSGGMVSVEVTTTKTSVLGKDELGSVLGAGGLPLSGAGTDLVGEAQDMGGLITELGARVTSRGEIVVVLDTDIFFVLDKATLKPEAKNTLSKVAQLIEMKDPKLTRIEGHTDSKGKDDSNLKLSQRRADSVKKWLVDKESLPAETFVTKGFGEQNPIAPNADSDGKDNPVGRAKNRRVEITLEP